MDTLAARCISCGHIYQPSVQMMGRNTACPACHRETSVPGFNRTAQIRCDCGAALAFDIASVGLTVKCPKCGEGWELSRQDFLDKDHPGYVAPVSETKEGLDLSSGPVKVAIAGAAIVVFLLIGMWLLSASHGSPPAGDGSQQPPVAATRTVMANLDRTASVSSSAICLAAKDGREDEVRALLEKGVSSNILGPGGETALHWAAAYGRIGVTKLLLARGADVNAKDGAGLTPLHHAAQEDQLEIVKFLLNKGATALATNEDLTTPVHLAAAEGHEGILRELLAAGADVNAIDSAGSTPLHLAAAYGRLNTVTLLLSKGADATIRDRDGHTAADLALANDHQEVASSLPAQSGQ